MLSCTSREIRVITKDIKKSIGIEGLIDRLMKVGLDIDVTPSPFGTLLIKAIMCNQFALAEKLIPHTLKSINAAREDNGYTALMYAAASNNVLLVEKLLQYGADPTLRNLKGNNAFMVAVCHRDEGMVEALLPYETKQSLNEENGDGKTSLAMATTLEWVFGEQAIVDAGGIIPGMRLKENTTPSQMRAEFFKFLQQSGSALRGGGSVPQRMLSNIFVEKGAADFPISYLDYASLNPDLRCLMTLTGWACNVYKSKIFFFDSRHNESLFFDARSDGRLNFSTHNIYCSYDGAMSISTISVFFHEAMHLVMDFIYQNWAKPYTSGNINNKIKFEVVLQKTKTRLDEMKPNLMWDTAKEAYDSIHSVYAYGPDDRASELIVRIPEILVSMGIDKGIEWLSQFEELMEYYNTIVIPDMENYILEDPYLSISLLQRDRYVDQQVPPPSFACIMRVIYKREAGYSILNKLEGVYKELTLDELTQIKKTASFFKCESAVIEQCEEYFKEWIHFYEMQERALRNRKILDKFCLDPNNEEHLQYWSSQVTWPGGCDYKAHRIPHTIANIFEMLKKISLIDTPPDELLGEIHRLRTEASGSRMGFFGISSMRSAITERFRTMSDDDFGLSFSPGGSCHGM